MGHARSKLPAVLLAFALLATPASPFAIAIRHDRTDADVLALGARFSAVGRVLPGGGCTLVAPTWAVTAAHVAAALKPDGEVQFGDGVTDVYTRVSTYAPWIRGVISGTGGG